MEFKMELKIEQKIIAAYFLLGVVVAFTSTAAATLSPSNGLVISLLTTFVIYVAALAVLLKVVKYKKVKTLLKTSFMAYFLIWFVVWVLLGNL